MKKIQLEKGELIVSKWKREGEDGVRGVKISIADNANMATVFVSLKDCEEIIVALFREKEEIKKDLEKKVKEAEDG